MNHPAPVPLLLLPIRPLDDVNRERLDHGLQQLTAEDASLGVLTNQSSGLVVIGAVSELQLEIVVDRLEREFGVEATVGKPEVVYQVMGRELDEDLDGEKVEAVVLEPVMRVDVTMPADCSRDVLRGLAMRRAQIEAVEVQGQTHATRAFVRLSEMFGFGADLRQRTDGRGTYSMWFDRYEPVRNERGPYDDDRTSRVGAPLKPAPGLNSSAIALPEPEADRTS